MLSLSPSKTVHFAVISISLAIIIQKINVQLSVQIGGGTVTRIKCFCDRNAIIYFEQLQNYQVKIFMGMFIFVINY